MFIVLVVGDHCQCISKDIAAYLSKTLALNVGINSVSKISCKPLHHWNYEKVIINCTHTTEI